MTQPLITFDFRDHTLQETHDHVVRFMRKQKVASVLPHSDMCAYRGVGENLTPTACAIGCAVPDAHYYRGMEGETADSLRDREAFQFAHCINETDDRTWNYLSDMQDAHDDFMPYPTSRRAPHDGRERSLAAFERRAASIAMKYGLAHPPLEPNTPSS